MKTLVASSLCLLMACGGDDDDDTPDAADTTDAGMDAAAPDAALDAGTDAAPAPSCDAPGEERFAVDADGPDTQIYSAAAFDGEGVWIAYCRPELAETGLFDVLLTRVGCDGEVQIPPIVLSGPANDVAPSLAISGDRILVAWLADTGNFPDNLDIMTRVVTTDGTLVDDAAQALETTRADAPVAGNQVDPDVAPLPDGGFVLAGGRAGEEVGPSQAFVQELDVDGQLVGEAVDVGLEPGIGQSSPAVAAGSDGRIWLAWVREEGDELQVYFREMGEGTVAEPAFPDEAATQTPALAVDAQDPARVWLAATVDQRVRIDIGLTDIALPAAERPVATMGARELDHSPVVVTTPAGGMVLYHRTIEGLRNEIIAQPFEIAGAELSVGAEVLLTGAELAAPYPLGFAAVSDEVFLASWSDGDNPAFYLRGRFFASR